MVPVGPSIGTAAFSSPVATSITWSLPSQPARKTRSPADVRATVGEQRIWSAIECVQRSLPLASSRQESDASCEPTSTRAPSGPSRIVGPPEISPSVSWFHRGSPVAASKARTMPTSSPTTTIRVSLAVPIAAAEENPASFVVNDQRSPPSASDTAWNVPSRSPTYTTPSAITGTAPKAVPSNSRCQASASGIRSVAAERPVPALQPRAIGQASGGAEAGSSAMPTAVTAAASSTDPSQIATPRFIARPRRGPRGQPP